MKILVEDEIKNQKLWKLMKDKKIQTSKQLATELIEKEIYTDFHRKTRNKDEVYDEKEIKKLNIDTLAKLITKWLYDGIYTNTKLLIACCKYFECSADYLLGFISSPTHEISQIHDVTGLSAKAIETLDKINHQYKYMDVLSQIIASPYFLRLLKIWNTLADQKTVERLTFQNIIDGIWNGASGKTQILRTRDENDTISALEFESNKILTSILESIRTEDLN